MSKQSRARAAAKEVANVSPSFQPNAFLARQGTLLAGGIIVLATLAAYRHSFSGPFVFDDFPAIVDNPTIRHLGSSWSQPPELSGVSGRPLINFSLAVNYALGGQEVRGYHALNLAIHILAALTLFGIVRRTLTSHRQARRSQISDLKSEILVALAVAVLWAVHPLQTESVTCIVQRTESLMGLFYLLTLYCFIRGMENQMSESRRQMPESRVQSPEKEIQKPSDFCPLPSVFWFTASVLFCLLGMASKEVMVSAPLMVLLYDRTFVGGTFREAWRRRWPFYAALAGTWLLLGYLVAGIGGTRGHAAGFGLGVTPWTYALTQCRAILHYLKLSVWPDRLTLDYGTGVTRHLADVLPQALALVSLVLATILGLYRRPVLGFVGAWFFAILAPSSSFLPLVTQTVAEHRMYLPLASVILLAVLGLYLWLGRRSAVIFLALAVGLGCLTERRNNDYRNNLTLWSDTVAKCPGNERAHTHLGLELLAIPGRLPDAIAEFRKALQINPDYADAHNDLGNALATLPGGLPDAISHFEAALRLSPDLAGAHNNLGNALLKIPGRLPDAISHFETALRLKPDFAGAHNSLGNALTAVPGRLPDAISHFERALQLEPDFAEAHSNLGNALLRLPGRVPDAIAQYEAALRIDPSLVETHYNLGNARLQQGNYPAAYEQFEDALKLKPDFAKGHLNLGVTLVKMGRLNDAIAQFETAQQIDPGDPSARRDLEIVQKSLPKDGDENGPRRPAP